MEVQTPDIEFWFDLSSNYSYLSAMRIEALAKTAGLRVQWRPFLLGPIFQAQGLSTSPFVLHKEKGAYTWKDMARQCEKYGLPWKKPSVFPRPATLAMKVAAAHHEAPWLPEYCRILLTRNFALDGEIESQDSVLEALRQAAAEAEAAVAQAQQGERKTALREATAEAQARGIFGAPSFFVGNELFWGNDRLDDALAYATRSFTA